MVQTFLVVVTNEVLGKNNVTRGKAGKHVSKEGRCNRARTQKNRNTGEDTNLVSKGQAAI